jgi:PAS domain S-box-containing protein
MEKPFETAQSSLELLYHISRELASSLELRKVLPRVLFLSLDAVGGTSGSVIVVDEKGQPVESAIIHTGHVYDQTTRQLRVTLEKGLAGWVADNQQAALVADTSQDERWLQRRDDSPERTGAKSAVSAPLLVEARLVGVITLVHPEPGFFDQGHLALVQAIADQAGIAVLNARLYADSRRQARIMSALAESAASINTALLLEDVLQRILEQTSQALGVEAASLALIDAQTGELEYRAATGLAAQDVIGIRLKPGQGVAGWVAREGRAVIVPQVEADPHFYPEVDRRTGFETRAIACAPIRSQGQVIGVVQAFNPTEGTFDTDALLVLSGIGSLAGTAIHNASLFERLQTAHQRYRDLFEDNIDPTLLTNWAGQIREVNRRAAQASGFSKEQLREMNIEQLHAIDRETTGPEFSRLSSQEMLSYESTLRSQEGAAIPVEVYVRQVEIDHLVRLQWIFRDLTERKKLESLREDLTSMVYHDLRAPLANISYSLEAIESLLPEEVDPSIPSVLQVANRSTERIQRLTRSLLDVQSLEAGQPLGKRQAVALPGLVEEALETILPMAASKHLEINTEIPADLPLVKVDEEMIHRVLVNLVDNAIKVSPLDGRITLGARKEGEMLQVWVQDEGPGIAPHDREKVFDKFTRLGSPNQGIGLGLTFCRLAVEAHGGRIWIESQPDQGARFAFTLPTG